MMSHQHQHINLFKFSILATPVTHAIFLAFFAKIHSICTEIKVWNHCLRSLTHTHTTVK